MKGNKRTPLIIMILLLVVGVTTGYVASTYAKYTSTLPSKSGSATVAKWAFTSDNQDSSFTFRLDETYNANTLVANKIAPGTSGKFELSLSNANTEVGVSYEIVINATNVPTNLKFYTDAAHTNPVQNNKITGTLTPNQASKDATIYWAWEYEIGTGETLTTNDAADTANGQTAATMTVPVTITGTQVTPVKIEP